ncbi:hypothetical protein HPB50_022703 [Hyalomma asiaticum]|uniref:Uncharacterized protein n=1 Tax=Hyalomma asiaticum TaxID=266040 RepID=A0ACB7RW08_HYAAI|nr:hypothetical protein HPB50_022703 [Hyalomma asiaticum]
MTEVAACLSAHVAEGHLVTPGSSVDTGNVEIAGLDRLVQLFDVVQTVLQECQWQGPGTCLSIGDLHSGAITAGRDPRDGLSCLKHLCMGHLGSRQPGQPVVNPEYKWGEGDVNDTPPADEVWPSSIKYMQASSGDDVGQPPALARGRTSATVCMVGVPPRKTAFCPSRRASW